MQARLSATFEGAPSSSAAGGAAASAAGGGAAAAVAASLSAFSAFSASRTSLVAAPRSGCCARSLASSGLKPRSGSATRSPRTASRRASDSHMRGASRGKEPLPSVARPRQSTPHARARLTTHPRSDRGHAPPRGGHRACGGHTCDDARGRRRRASRCRTASPSLREGEKKCTRGLSTPDVLSGGPAL
eukprot:scaffold36150_cov54-Phaeocystis_antarctica.AAC.5